MDQEDGSLALVAYAVISFYVVVSALLSVGFGWIFGTAVGLGLIKALLALLALALIAAFVVRRKNAKRTRTAAAARLRHSPTGRQRCSS